MKRKTHSAKVGKVVNANFSHLDYILGYNKDERKHEDTFQLYIDNIVRTTRKEYLIQSESNAIIRDYIMQLLDEDTKNKDTLEGKIKPVVDFRKVDILTLYLEKEGLTPDKAMMGTCSGFFKMIKKTSYGTIAE
ncbi:MAG: hypothetical protein V1859_04415 [archaeon]